MIISKVTPLNTDKAHSILSSNYRHKQPSVCLWLITNQSTRRRIIATNAVDQTHQCLENLKHILSSDGLTLDDALKTTVYLANIQDFAATNEVYAKYFQEPYLARAVFEVAALAQGTLVEIELVAAK